MMETDVLFGTILNMSNKTSEELQMLSWTLSDCHSEREAFKNCLADFVRIKWAMTMAMTLA